MFRRPIATPTSFSRARLRCTRVTVMRATGLRPISAPRVVRPPGIASSDVLEWSAYRSAGSQILRFRSHVSASTNSASIRGSSYGRRNRSPARISVTQPGWLNHRRRRYIGTRKIGWPQGNAIAARSSSRSTRISLVSSCATARSAAGSLGVMGLRWSSFRTTNSAGSGVTSSSQRGRSRIRTGKPGSAVFAALPCPVKRPGENVRAGRFHYPRR